MFNVDRSDERVPLNFIMCTTLFVNSAATQHKARQCIFINTVYTVLFDIILFLQYKHSRAQLILKPYFFAIFAISLAYARRGGVFTIVQVPTLIYVQTYSWLSDSCIGSVTESVCRTQGYLLVVTVDEKRARSSAVSQIKPEDIAQP